jgi:hypothetical protein
VRAALGLLYDAALNIRVRVELTTIVVMISASL